VVEISRTHVVVTVEEYEQDADSGWKQEKTVFRERVGIEKPSTIVHTNLVEGLFIIAVKWCEVNIRRRLVNAHIMVRCAENAFRKVDQIRFVDERQHETRSNLRMDDKGRE